MKLFTLTAPLAELTLFAAAGFALPPRHETKREISRPGIHTSLGGVNEIMAWTGAALAYGAVGAATDVSQLAYVCSNFDSIAKPWLAAFNTTAGDVTQFGRKAICNSATGSTLPAIDDTLWYLRTYLSATFTIQTYFGSYSNSTHYGWMCWLMEDSLLSGLWVQNPDNQLSGVDAEGSFCANSGQYSKGPATTYTDQLPSAAIQKQATTLLSRLLARGLQIILSADSQVQFVCDKFSAFTPGINKLGLDPGAIKEVLCAPAKAVAADAAVKACLVAMTNLFSFQLFNGGTDPLLFPYLCENLKVSDLQKVKLDGELIKKNACALAAAQ